MFQRSTCEFHLTKVLKNGVCFVIFLVLAFGLIGSTFEKFSFKALIWGLGCACAALMWGSKLITRHGRCPACGELNEAVAEGEVRPCTNDNCRAQLQGNKKELWLC